MFAKFPIDLSSRSGEEDFKNLLIFNPRWLTNHVIYDIINLYSASNRVVEHVFEVSCLSDKVRFSIQDGRQTMTCDVVIFNVYAGMGVDDSSQVSLQ